MIRTFKLENAVGNVLDLMDLNHFGHNPKGLGIELDNDFVDNGMDFLFKKAKQSQAEIQFEAIFGIENQESYSVFEKTASFFNFPPFVLQYSFEEGKLFYRDCRLKSLSKSEIGSSNALEENLVLILTGPWYQWKEGSLAEYIDHEGDGKAYDFNYPYIYEDNFTDNRYFFLLDNDSRYFGLRSSSPLEIVITAGNEPIVNPSWSIRQEDNIFQSDGYFLTLNPGDQLVVSSNPQAQKAVIYIAGEEPRNVYQQQDVTKTNFVTAPTGKSTLFFENCKGATITYRLKQEAVLV